ncbi:AAA family ATPase [Nocardia sp. NPDC005825]|uniref:AAA family ATPase n=1 Tax=unclassified Nocardia TaxID=2637762 RepID=UPI0033E3D78E
MTERQLDAIKVEGFTSIRSATIPLGRLNVLVGANGAGKSNLVHAFEMLGRIVDGELGLFVGMNGGASALSRRQRDTEGIRPEVRSDPNRYVAELIPAANDELIFGQEWVSYQADGYDRPYDKSLGRGQRESRLPESQESNRIAAHVSRVLEGCRVFHFHDTSATAPVKQFVDVGDNLALRRDAGNLAAVLLDLQDSHPASYRRIVGGICQVAPFFRDFVLQPESGGRIRLRWRETDSDAVFSANQMSDGTLRFVCLTTLLLHPRLPMLVVLDEPELGLHPYAIVALAGLLRQASVHSQVLIATQSVTLMNQMSLEDLIIVERRGGESVFTRPDPEELGDWLQDYSLGELWEKNLIGGRPTGTGRDG